MKTGMLLTIIMINLLCQYDYVDVNFVDDIIEDNDDDNTN